MSIVNRRSGLSLVVVAAVIGVASAFAPRVVGAASNKDKCEKVFGLLEDHIVPCPAGSSAIICTAGRTLGALHGSLNFQLLGEIPSKTQNVAFYDAQEVWQLDKGDLNFDEAGATNGVTGDFSVLQTITGGTGAFVGATGQLFQHGSFDFATGTGQGEYTGTVCPR